MNVLEETFRRKYAKQILDLEIELAKLKVELKYYKNELELCREEK